MSIDNKIDILTNLIFECIKKTIIIYSQFHQLM